MEKGFCYLSPLFHGFLLSLLLINSCTAQVPGFVSINCGGEESFTDELGLDWIPDKQFAFGETINISVVNETRTQYKTLRHFPVDNRKYCYTINVTTRTRYLVRAAFLYGDFDNSNVYPKFDLSLGSTFWSTIVISDGSTIETRELIFLASDPTVSVCLSNATTGKPFISTLELRQFNGSMYYTDFEEQFYLGVSARINFGAESADPVRYPDDPYDRLWESDSLKKANYLVDVAIGTKKVSTRQPIDVNRDERPPQKVMQTAVVGTNGSLTYRLNLDGFPGAGWACSYFAEIEDLAPNEKRKFRLVLPGSPDIRKDVVNIMENAQGKYRLYEPGFTNLSFPFVLAFKFGKTSDSFKGPLLNAMEINKYIPKIDGSLDVAVIAGALSSYLPSTWAQEGGDPCLPVPWSWVRCNSEPAPRITAIILSSKNMTGSIPLAFTKLTGLIELWLDGNSLTGPIPDFSSCVDLKIIHLENNQLTDELPLSLLRLPNLEELYLQNNMLSGNVPSDLIGRSLIFNCTGNPNIRIQKKGSQAKIIVGASVGAACLLIVTIALCIYINKLKSSHASQGEIKSNAPARRMASTFKGPPAEAAHCFMLSEIEEATRKFEKKIGSGGFGVVYYGKQKDDREIAVKVLINDSYQGKREFSNESVHCQVVGASTGSSALRSPKMLQEAKLHIESGDIQGIIDPNLREEYDIQSMWKIAEKALMCVQPHGHMRPSISEVLKEIQDAILIERAAFVSREGLSDDMSRNSCHSSLNLVGAEHCLSIDESVSQPTAR
ncbi:hypothetical protein SAY86_021914 [Trapa natans]|uniref:Malectin-like domain-containing protein n=1 Tax=Trapa natans TaxID=22666 RepID=A0AAN7ML64_TRANT|nr:hypothetical protein SAY86_021914 [Trapa natans]